jgi:hypothetical protein
MQIRYKRGDFQESFNEQKLLIFTTKETCFLFYSKESLIEKEESGRLEK